MVCLLFGLGFNEPAPSDRVWHRFGRTSGCVGADFVLLGDRRCVLKMVYATG